MNENHFNADCPKCQSFGLNVLTWTYKGEEKIVLKCPECSAILLYDPRKPWSENEKYNVEILKEKRNMPQEVIDQEERRKLMVKCQDCIRHNHYYEMASHKMVRCGHGKAGHYGDYPRDCKRFKPFNKTKHPQGPHGPS